MALVLIPDKEHGWVLARLQQRRNNGSLVVSQVLPDGRSATPFCVSPWNLRAELQPFNQQLPVWTSNFPPHELGDLTILPEVTGAHLLCAIRARFLDGIYRSWLGPNCLVSVNPSCIRKDEDRDGTSTRAASTLMTTNPDIPELGQLVGELLSSKARRQSVLILGVASSGKTLHRAELMKRLLMNTDNDMVQRVVDAERVLQTFIGDRRSLLLTSFLVDDVAKKVAGVKYSVGLADGTMMSGHMQKRGIFHTAAELLSLDTEGRLEGFPKPTNIPVLQKDPSHPQTVKDFQESLCRLSIDSITKDVLDAMAGILWIGQVSVMGCENGEVGYFYDKAPVEKAASLLNMPTEKLSAALLSPDDTNCQSRFRCNAVVTLVYEAMVDRIIQLINVCLSPAATTTASSPCLRTINIVDPPTSRAHPQVNGLAVFLAASVNDMLLTYAANRLSPSNSSNGLAVWRARPLDLPPEAFSNAKHFIHHHKIGNIPYMPGRLKPVVQAWPTGLGEFFTCSNNTLISKAISIRSKKPLLARIHQAVGDVLTELEGPDTSFYAVSCLQAGNPFTGIEVHRQINVLELPRVALAAKNQELKTAFQPNMFFSQRSSTATSPPLRQTLWTQQQQQRNNDQFHEAFSPERGAKPQSSPASPPFSKPQAFAINNMDPMAMGHCVPLYVEQRAVEYFQQVRMSHNPGMMMEQPPSGSDGNTSFSAAAQPPWWYSYTYPGPLYHEAAAAMRGHGRMASPPISQPYLGVPFPDGVILDELWDADLSEFLSEESRALTSRSPAPSDEENQRSWPPSPSSTASSMSSCHEHEVGPFGLADMTLEWFTGSDVEVPRVPEVEVEVGAAASSPTTYAAILARTRALPMTNMTVLNNLHHDHEKDKEKEQEEVDQLLAIPARMLRNKPRGCRGGQKRKKKQQQQQRFGW